MEKQMRKLLLLALLLVPYAGLFAQGPKIDSVAVLLIDRMGMIIGDLNSCSFTLNTSLDINDPDLGLVKHFNQHSVCLSGPDKMLIQTNGYKGHRGFWYDGKSLHFYSYGENNYAVIPAPDNTIATIDSVNKTYDIEFPAADFFYPTFTDDLLAASDVLSYAGKSQVGGINCFQIVAKGKDKGVQIWLSDDEWFLPVKYVICYYNTTPTVQYEATFSDWKINQQMPDAMFEFSPPPGARRIEILAK